VVEEGAFHIKSMLWNANPDANATDCPLELVTEMSTDPELCAGVTATIVEELLSETDVAASPPKVTDTPV
jgi:hypothetical protein